ncbi:MAG: 3-hydroxyacyl-CoA dehydrogenase NAD-binding domain-containing protein [Alphaproteobacteria bacterium]|nr:3-hydroxyacyl-CoA dehydrogenase NAD-binding domain-containing protein [Alphaproteobacteria bacterium]
MPYPTPDSLDRVAVIGTGTIGASWATLFLARGMAVNAYDPGPGALDSLTAYINRAWPVLQELGAIVPGADQTAIEFYNDPAQAVRGMSFIQESVPERLDVKHALFSAMEPGMADNAILATSSSGLLIKDMQKGLKRPDRLVLAHPFNPPHLIPLVELLGNDLTDPAAVDWCQGFFEDRCGKKTIRVLKEVPAHVANRLQAALWREAIHLVLEGVASVEDVDKAVVHGPGLRWSIMGPHMLFNLASGGKGLEVFIERFGPSFAVWWESLGRPDLTPENAAILAEGCHDEEAGRSFEELSAERDEKLVAVLKQFRMLESKDNHHDGSDI